MRTRRSHFFLAAVTIIAALGPGAMKAASSEPQDSTPQQVFDGMRESFRAEKTKGLHVRYQFNLRGPNGGDWFIEVNDGKLKMNRGRIDNPNVTFIASDRDWVALSNGTLGGPWAFMTGRLKIRGDRALAKKLDVIFPKSTVISKRTGESEV
ncbi:MAG: SCP2 sterol-binding domain-containing protein [Verrucomicrobiota bacterium]